jgi:DNA-binding NtrC family response regulator
MARIEYVDETGQIRSYELTPGRHLLGRHDCAIPVPHETVSGVHCWFQVRGGTCTVHDVSRNGTFLHGRPADSTLPLVDGDAIQVGTEVVTYRADAPAPPSRVSASTAPVPIDEIRAARARLATPQPVTRRIVRDPAGSDTLAGSSPVMVAIRADIAKLARHKRTVLITGESGTGKELAAKALHAASGRKGELVVINAASLRRELIESELFGHEKGSFTGAEARTDGAFQRADGGTLFIDEIGELPLPEQPSLLRALESGEVRRVGGKRPEFPDVRVIAATHQDLPAMVASGAFRKDLYQRLDVLRLRMPALRERVEDIPAIVEALLAREAEGQAIQPDAVRMLQAFPWTGNIRELRNALIRAAVRAEDRPIGIGDLDLADAAPDATGGTQAAERARYLELLAVHGPSRRATADAIGMDPATFRRKLQKLGIPTNPRDE